AQSIPIDWRMRFLVALPPERDLLLRAKYLFVAAIADGDAARPGSGAICGAAAVARNCRRRPRTHGRKRPRALELGGEPGRGLSLQSGSNIGLSSLCMWERCWRRREPFLSPTSSGRYRLVALTPFRGFARLRQRFVR